MKNNSKQTHEGTGKCVDKRDSQNSRNKKGRYRGKKDRSDYASKRTSDLDARNDLAWYTRYPSLINAAAQYPYPYRPGMTLSIGNADTSVSGLPVRKYDIPGALVLQWIPSLGTAQTATDPVNATAREIYARVRKAYSGSLSADAPDFIVYLTCMDSIFSYIAWLKRIYRLLNTWTPENHIIPDRLLNSMGLYSALPYLRTYRTALWGYINELVHMANKFFVPNSFDVINRHYWMNDHVYLDTNSPTGQIYMFNQRQWYRYVTATIPDGSGNTAAGASLATPNLDPPTSTVENLYNFGLSLINSLAAWDDAYTISGYLMRAFEGSAPFRVDEIEQGVLQEFSYNEEVLMQIENSRTIPGGFKMLDPSFIRYGQQGVVTQNPATNAIIVDNSYTIPNALTDVSLLDTFTVGGDVLNPFFSLRVQPSPGANVIASRLHASTKRISLSGTPTGSLTLQIDCGTEIPICWQIFGKNSVPNEGTTAAAISQTPGIIATTSPTSADVSRYIGVITRITELEVFDWHPFVILTFGQETSTAITYQDTVRIAGDINLVTSVTQADLANLHKICLYSEYDAFSLIE